MAIRAPYVAAATSLNSVTDACSAPQCSRMMCLNTHFSRRLSTQRPECRLDTVSSPTQLRAYTANDERLVSCSTAIAMVLLAATARGRTLRQHLDTTPLLSGLLVIGESPTQLHRPLKASYGFRTAPRSHR